MKNTLELCRRFETAYELCLSKVPFHMNLLDLCGANENAHTRILIQLLKYRDQNKHPFLNSLLNVWFANSGRNVPEINHERVKFIFNRDYIDGLIFDGHIGIIIENKIHYAIDQNKQIERYVESVKSRGCSFENIYVVYLTRNGDKTITEVSCSQCFMEKLGDRFIKSNYQKDILPWLEKDVLPRCRLKDACLIEALKQYVDHLKGLLMMRNENSMQQELIEWLKHELAWKPSVEKYGRLKKQEEVVRQLLNIMGYLSQEHCAVFEKITEEFWKNHFGGDFEKKGDVCNVGWIFCGKKKMEF